MLPPDMNGSCLVGRGISLVAMPWASLETPSIQLGVLTEMLRREGLHVTPHSLFVEAALYFSEHSTALDPPLTVEDYQQVANHGWSVGLGDWVFANAACDDAYVAYLRSERVPERTVQSAGQFRALAPAFLEHCASEILSDGAAIVGFTSTFSQNLASLALARLLKQRHPEIIVVFGGANCDGDMGAALHRLFPWVDIVVRGEAEPVFPGLCQEILAGKPITPRPGLCLRRDGQSVAVPLVGEPRTAPDDFPMPNYDEFFDRLERTPMGRQVRYDVRLPIETSRGCWWGSKMHCTFCGLNGSTMAFRSKRPERALDEIVTLAQRYRQLDFEAVDNIMDMAYLRDLLPQLAEARRRGLDYTFFYETKANLRHEHVRALRDAGVVRIQPGIESLSTPILRLMRKGITALQNIRLLKWAARYDVHVTWNVIYGFPGEPQEEYIRMADLVPSLVHLKPPGLVRLQVHRFSPYHDTPAAWGLHIVGPAPYYPFLYDLNTHDLLDLAYCFDYDYVRDENEGIGAAQLHPPPDPGPPDPESYVAPLRDALRAWDDSYRRSGYRSLRYWSGPGFIRIRDVRPGLPAREYVLRDVQAEIYLRCDAGTTPRMIRDTLLADGIGDVPVQDIAGFLDMLAERRLVYAEGGRYLSLALPMNVEADLPNTSPTSVLLLESTGIRERVVQR